MDSTTKCQEIAPNDLKGLHPITPAQSNRYSKPGGIVPSSKSIPPGFFSRQVDPEPCYLPFGWSNFTQAEGQLYFYNKETRFVTEANIYDPEKLKRITRWMAVAIKLAESQKIQITDSIEIMLQLDSDDEESCGYYLIEHGSSTVFWLHEVSSEDLDIPDSASYSQLRWTCNEYYWTHVEYFSAHISGLRMSSARELISILTHARADHLTSTVGTFPYGANQCKEFVDLLRDHVSNSSEVLSDSYIICIVARLWAQVARHRFLNFYGEENARLSRDQRVVNDSPQEPSFFLKAFSRAALLNIPCTYATELSGLWVDNLVYAEPWKVYINSCLDDWKETAVWTMALTSIHAALYLASFGSSAVGITSLALSIFGFISSMVLVNYHRISMVHETIEAAAFLDWTYHSKLGFTPLSCVYSLPKAALFWSTGLLALQGAFSIFEVLPISNRFLAGVLVCLTVAVLYGVVSVLRRQNVFRRIRCSTLRLFTSVRRDEDLERNDDDFNS